MAVLRGHTGNVNSVAFSPSGSQLLTTSNDASVRVWDVRTWQTLKVLTGHHGSVLSATFSPSEQRIVTASEDKTARIWDARTFEEIAVLAGHADAVRTASYSPDGQQILTASNDKTARIWRQDELPSLETQIEWSWAAQFDRLSDTDRVNLGLPETHRSNSTREHRDAVQRALVAVAERAAGAETRAITETDPRRRHDMLLEAFRLYAYAAARALAEDLPDETWRVWRYQRANIARLFKREGSEREIAVAFRDAEHEEPR